jgi:hypothetical protein
MSCSSRPIVNRSFAIAARSRAERRERIGATVAFTHEATHQPRKREEPDQHDQRPTPAAGAPDVGQVYLDELVDG